MAVYDFIVPRGYCMYEDMNHISIVIWSGRFPNLFFPQTMVQKNRKFKSATQTMLYSLINCVNFVHSLG